jgi:uncharacterized membrane protein YkvA (DUF1232 family)
VCLRHGESVPLIAAVNDPLPVDATVVDSTVVDEGAMRRLLRRAGRTVARPAVECLELLLDGATPHTVRLTMLAALTYLLVPTDLIPDFLPIAGFSDDLVALTALLGMFRSHLNDGIREKAQRRLDNWFC